MGSFQHMYSVICCCYRYCLYLLCSVFFSQKDFRNVVVAVFKNLSEPSIRTPSRSVAIAVVPWALNLSILPHKNLTSVIISVIVQE